MRITNSSRDLEQKIELAESRLQYSNCEKEKNSLREKIGNYYRYLRFAKRFEKDNGVTSLSQSLW